MEENAETRKRQGFAGCSEWRLSHPKQSYFYDEKKMKLTFFRYTQFMNIVAKTDIDQAPLGIERKTLPALKPTIYIGNGLSYLTYLKFKVPKVLKPIPLNLILLEFDKKKPAWSSLKIEALDLI